MSKVVALLVGGWSSERDVSLKKGKAIESALKEAGYKVRVVDVSKNLSQLVADLTPKPDVVFNNLYGRGGEDGTIQGLLEIMAIPYTHSGVTASAIGMDKPLTRMIAEKSGIRVAEGCVASKDDVLKEDVMLRPYVVKPLNEGSSVGVTIIFEGENQKPLNEETWEFGDKVLIEQYIPGREIHVTVLDGKAQGVTEIIAPGRFFDYDAKYNDQRTELITPANIPSIVSKKAMENAEIIFKALDCHGLARCDFRFDDTKSEAEGVYFLEINTMPGLAPGSVALIQPECNGYTLPSLCEHLVETARLHNTSWPNKKEKQERSDPPLLNGAPKTVTA